MDDKLKAEPDKDQDSKVGQGYNDARGEIEDKKDIPKGNGLNVDNDPSHVKEKESRKK